MKDLSFYSVQVLDALKLSLDDYDMFIPPPPSGGAILTFILNTMRGEWDQKHTQFHFKVTD